MQTRVITVSGAQQAAAAAEGARALQAGALVGFATETVYGLAALATDLDAMNRLRELKGRPARPFSVHLGKPQDVYRYVEHPNPDARKLIAKALPGPVTLLLPTGGKLADPRFEPHLAKGLYDRLVYEGVIGLRCPDEPVAQAMLSAVDGPVVAPSANRTGAPSPRNAQEVLDALDGRIDLLIDSGPTRYGKDSTIVDFSAEPWRIVRQGVYDARTLRKMMRSMYLFVCTGNTCRSPIAMGLARKMLAGKLGVKPGELAKRGVEVVSAGLFAADGAKVSPEAVEATAELGGDISRHRSRKLTMELINSADLIFCMTQAHVDQVLELAPQAAGKVQRLDDAGDIPDPIGGGVGTYYRTAKRIENALQRRLEGLP